MLNEDSIPENALFVPPEVIKRIFFFATDGALRKCAQVSRAFNVLVAEELHQRYIGNIFYTFGNNVYSNGFLSYSYKNKISSEDVTQSLDKEVLRLFKTEDEVLTLLVRAYDYRGFNPAIFKVAYLDQSTSLVYRKTYFALHRGVDLNGFPYEQGKFTATFAVVPRAAIFPLQAKVRDGQTVIKTVEYDSLDNIKENISTAPTLRL